MKEPSTLQIERKGRRCCSGCPFRLRSGSGQVPLYMGTVDVTRHPCA